MAPLFLYTDAMYSNAAAYRPADTVIHRADARVKILLLLAFSVALFWVVSPVGMMAAALVLFALALLVRLPFASLARSLAPVGVIVAFTLVFNGFALSEQGVVFSLVGFSVGCIASARMIMLVCASAILTVSTASEECASALRWLLKPLSALHVDVDGVAMVVSVALRFIPLLFDEVHRIKDAMMCRGAGFEARSAVVRLSSWARLFVPLFVGLYRKAYVLSQAMIVRCYDLTPEKTQLTEVSLTPLSVVCLVLGLALCAALVMMC